MKKKVIVAMSGGVDSSTVAALLKDEGYDVIGITMQLYDSDWEAKTSKTCCVGKDIYDAKNAAAAIGIPHYVVNYESNFKKEVIDKFADSYINGKTPIPCILCNQKIKFRDLLKAADDLQIDLVATGHYVRRIDYDNHIELHKGIDEKKDQSYFLFTTTQEQLKKTLFPLGGFTKEYTRSLAHKYGLEIANKPDSQDICFVPNGNYRDIVAQLRPEGLKEGLIINSTGKVMGKHNGIINYTVGQRRGINISYSEPLYVLSIDAKENKIIIGTKNELKKETFIIDDMNWLIAKQQLNCTVKVRSGHEGILADIQPINDTQAEVTIFGGYTGITPGQACVMYWDTRMLGGGWINV